MNINMNKNKQGGFTLVEIAIVLVIIGLLLGGILKGQELINSARVRNLADQNSGVQAAYYGFIDRYRAVPGDMTPTNACAALGDSNLTGCGSGGGPGGDGNGRIDGSSDTDVTEASAMWAHLGAANFITGVYPGTETTLSAYSGDDAPINAFQAPIILWYNDDYLTSVGSTTERLAYFFGPQIPVNIIRELDVKLDDGQPYTGVVRGSTDTATGNPTYSAAACVEDDAGIWDIDANSPDCNAVYLY